MLLFLAIACLATVATGARPNVIPLPSSYSGGNTDVNISPYFTISLVGAAKLSISLQLGVLRYEQLIFPFRTTYMGDGFNLEELQISVDSLDESLNQETDESYTLIIPTSSSPIVTIHSATIYGALRGLETLSQMVEVDSVQDTFMIANAPWNVTDTPRYNYRGLLLDTSRHFFPIPTIYSILDSMSYSKLNVFHWHIVDAQSFPMEIKGFSKLWDGAYSKFERYRQSQIRDVVEYARLRGIRVVVETDGPGHMYAWGIGYPEILPENWNTVAGCSNQCTPSLNTNPCNVPINPAVQISYDVFDGVMSELTGNVTGEGMFPEDFIHLGGDEVESGCWSASPTIKEMMTLNNYTSYMQVYLHFVQAIQTMAFNKGRTPIHWEEVFVNFGEALDKRVIIHIWKDFATLAKVISAGYRAIVSNNSKWYLDGLNVKWNDVYNNEPMEAVDPAHPEQAKLILGGQICMWGETVDSSNVQSTIWPRTAAAAERLWSPQSVTDLTDMEIRLEKFHCLLHSRGIQSGSLNEPGRTGPLGPSSCLVHSAPSLQTEMIMETY